MSNLVCKVLFSLLGVYFVVYFVTMATMLPVSDEPVAYDPPERNSAYVISLTPPARLLGEIKTHLKTDAKHVQAVNKSDTFQYKVPLYTLHTMEYGRHDHMQIGNREMLGCLLSHVSVWKQFLNSTDETVLVFEEDAIIDKNSAGVLGSIWEDLRGRPGWSVVMLERGHTTSGAGWRAQNTSKLLMSCSTGLCQWFGTRGYLLSRGGASLLLKHVEPYVVQVDALILLVSTWEPLFVMLATNTNVAHASATGFLRTTLWDGCLKCFVPIVGLWNVMYVIVAVILIGFVFVSGFHCIGLCNSKQFKIYLYLVVQVFIVYQSYIHVFLLMYDEGVGCYIFCNETI